MPTVKYSDVQTLRDHLDNHSLEVTDVSRVICSSGVINLIEINGTFRLRVDGMWTSYWTSKWNALSEPDMLVWLSKLLNKRLPSFLKEVNHHSIYIIQN